MTPARLAQILADLQPLGLSARGLAALWGYASENSIRKLLSGRGSPTPEQAAWLEQLHAWWRAHPAPAREGASGRLRVTAAAAEQHGR